MDKDYEFFVHSADEMNLRIGMLQFLNDAAYRINNLLIEQAERYNYRGCVYQHSTIKKPADKMRAEILKKCLIKKGYNVKIEYPENEGFLLYITYAPSYNVYPKQKQEQE